MKVGTARISDTQRRILNVARETGDPGIWREFMHRFVGSPEVQSGREEIHPDWPDLFEEQKEQVREYFPRRYYEELSRFISDISPYDPQIGELDPTKAVVSFLLGAGASKPEPSGIPTVKELLPDLLARARRLDRDDVTKLADFCKNRAIDNIEDLLTAAQLATFCSRNPAVLGLLDFLLYREPDENGRRSRRRSDPGADLSSVAFLQDTLQVLFGLLSSRMLPAKPNEGHTAIGTYVGQHTQSHIVTTNYDCCMDLALGKEGEHYTYEVEFANVGGRFESHHPTTRLIKLHGSLNWFYCDTCQDVQLTDIQRTIDDFLGDRAPYPVIGVCKGCGGQRRPLLVPPQAMKFDIAAPLTPLLAFAAEGFRKAELIVVVGFSFAEADLYISRMLSKSLATSQNQRVVIADPAQEVAAKVRRRFEATIPDFDVSRVMRLRGDCSETLPEFLAGRLVRQPEESVTAVAD